MSQVIGLDSFIRDLGIAAKETKPVVEKAALAMALAVRRIAQGKVPKRSTILAQSIIADSVPYGAMTTVNEKYGEYLEYGTGLYGPLHHLIYPTTAQAMVWEEGGMRYGARWTRGMEAQPFFWPAVDEAAPGIGEQMRLAADSLIKTAVGGAA